MLFLHRCDREPRAFLADEHFGEELICLQRLEWDEFLESRDVLEIDEIPTRFFLGGGGVEVFGFFFELGGVRVGRGGDFGDACDAGRLRVRVVEEGKIADFHIAPHEVARLVVADAGPRLLLDLFEIVDGEAVGFGFDEPVHGKC